MLTSAQEATLDYHLRETNLLTNEELILELTDHYTTALLERMAQGMTFVEQSRTSSIRDSSSPHITANILSPPLAS